MRKYILWWLYIGSFSLAVSLIFTNISSGLPSTGTPVVEWRISEFPFVKKGFHSDPRYFQIDEEILMKYIHENENLDIKDSYGWSPIHYATNRDLIEAMRALLEKGANPNIKTSDRSPVAPLHLAVYGEVDMVILLLEHQADVNIQTGHYKFTPLHFAAEWGEPEITSILLENGADHSIKDRLLGWTALDGATSREKLQNVNLLLDAGAEPNRNPDERTTFDIAVKRGNNQIARLVSKDTKDYWQQMWRYLRLYKKVPNVFY